MISVAPILAQRRLVLAAASVLLCWFTLVVSASAASIILEVEAANAPPGFNKADLSRYLALHMTEAGLTEWRFEPVADNASRPNRVVWSFKLNPYAGGEVKSFARRRERRHSVTFEV